MLEGDLRGFDRIGWRMAEGVLTVKATSATMRAAACVAGTC